MKTCYCVSVDFTMSKNIYVDAENEEQAKRIVNEKIQKNQYDYARDFSHCVGYDIIDAYDY